MKAASSDEDDDDNNEDSEDSSDDDSSDEDDEDEDESESKEGGKGRKQYIEMVCPQSECGLGQIRVHDGFMGVMLTGVESRTGCTGGTAEGCGGQCADGGYKDAGRLGCGDG